MALDRDSIVKHDFPMGRRGYDPDAVDAHLSAIANEVEQLSTGGSLAGAASAQVRAIVEAAEATAAQIRAEAEAEAERVRGEARSQAKAAAADAAAEAGGRMEQLSSSAAAMLDRIEAIDQELTALLDALRGSAGRLNARIDELQEELGSAAQAAPAGTAGRSARPRATTQRSTPAATATPKPEAPAEPEPASAPAPAPAARTAGNSDHEAARLVALNMALSRSSREEVARHLSEHYILSDQDTLIDEVFAAVGG